MAECRHHAVDEGLAADQADLGMGCRLRREMLAAAEADLEPQRFRAGMVKPVWIGERPRRRQGERR
jgi:hypothetical protein